MLARLSVGDLQDFDLARASTRLPQRASNSATSDWIAGDLVMASAAATSANW